MLNFQSMLLDEGQKKLSYENDTFSLSSEMFEFGVLLKK